MRYRASGETRIILSLDRGFKPVAAMTVFGDLGLNPDGTCSGEQPPAGRLMETRPSHSDRVRSPGTNRLAATRQHARPSQGKRAARRSSRPASTPSHSPNREPIVTGVFKRRTLVSSRARVTFMALARHPVKVSRI